MKNGERRRSGRRDLAQDFEPLAAEAALAYDFEQPEYVEILIQSNNMEYLDPLSEAKEEEDR